MEEEKKKERKPKRIAVRVVAQEGKSALVEWEAEGDLCRAYVPAAKIEGGQCDEDTLVSVPRRGFVSFLPTDHSMWSKLVDGFSTPKGGSDSGYAERNHLVTRS